MLCLWGWKAEGSCWVKVKMLAGLHAFLEALRKQHFLAFSTFRRWRFFGSWLFISKASKAASV